MKVIDCPFCEGKASIKQEDRTFNISGFKVTLPYDFYQCDICRETFTTTEVDEENLKNIKEKVNNRKNEQT